MSTMSDSLLYQLKELLNIGLAVSFVAHTVTKKLGRGLFELLNHIPD
jgi:hypothetical protein